MKKGLAVLGTTVAGGLTAGVVSGMIINKALKYKPEDLERDLAKKDMESIKENMKLKDKVITGVSFAAGLAFVALGIATGSTTSSAGKEIDDDESKDSEVTINYFDCTGVKQDDVDDMIDESMDSDSITFESYDYTDEDTEYQQDESEEL